MMSNGLVSENKLRNGSRVRGRGKSTDLVSCKQRHDLVCAQLRIIRGNPLANTFLLFISSFSLLLPDLFLSSFFYYKTIIICSTYRVQIYLLFYYDFEFVIVLLFFFFFAR